MCIVFFYVKTSLQSTHEPLREKKQNESFIIFTNIDYYVWLFLICSPEKTHLRATNYIFWGFIYLKW